ncbi:MAG: elongation factor 4 [Planctomycetota bacterium]|nr:elongation factor 4 [Planctomycetota bacterium]GIK52703.1 MAG: elongation factor 4 [Planctomycetota bacterium]
MPEYDQPRIRNFSIIAHIDHGKSTLADRLLQASTAVDQRKIREQTMDSMDLERERGITIKAKAVALPMVVRGEKYLFNLIDTPGHVDFGYEVSRALAACEGALLLVDTTQGIQAQTVANMYLAMGADLHVIPCANKVDMQASRFEETVKELEQVFGLKAEEVIKCSGKTGFGVEDIIQAAVDRIPQPSGNPDAPLKALIFDAVYDDYRGVVMYVRVRDGFIESRQKIALKATKSQFEVLEVGVVRLGQFIKQDRLDTGCVGYVMCGIKTIQDVGIGDTITLSSNLEQVEALPGYKKPQPMVYAGIYPVNAADFDALRKGLARLSLSDSAFTYAPENSGALGTGFRCGYLGLLHMDIVQERLERESGLDLVQTAPNVSYEVLQTDGSVIRVDSAADMPEITKIQEIREPVARLNVIAPTDCIGDIMKLTIERRGIYENQEHLGADRVMLTYRVPLAEIIFDYFDRLKSITRGYGTMDYEIIGFEPGDLVKLRILVAGEDVDALSMIVHRQFAETRGRKVLVKLREEIPRQLFVISLQAAIGGKIIAGEKISALRKDVLAKCYGGDVSRKRKLLEKQKRGKARMKMIGGVEVPQSAFLSILQVSNEE